MIHQQMDEGDAVFRRGLLILSADESAVDHHMRGMKPGVRCRLPRPLRARSADNAESRAVAEQFLQFAVLFQRERRDVSATDPGFVVGKRDGAVADRADNLAR